MPSRPMTADERDRRTVQYLLTLHKGELAEFRYNRLGRISNFRKALIQLIEEFVQAKAEEIAAGMLAEHAPARPERQLPPSRSVRIERRGRPPAAARVPVWVKRAGEAR